MFSHLRTTLKPLYIAIALLAAVQVAGCSSPEEQAQEHYERGMELLAKNDTVRASIEFKNALQKKKDLIGAWRALCNMADAQYVPALSCDIDPELNHFYECYGLEDSVRCGA